MDIVSSLSAVFHFLSDTKGKKQAIRLFCMMRTLNPDVRKVTVDPSCLSPSISPVLRQSFPCNERVFAIVLE